MPTSCRADTGKLHYYLLTGKCSDPPTNIDLQYSLPAGFTCTRCVQQMEYYTYNTCLEDCPREECGFYADRMNYIIPTDQGPKPICPQDSYNKFEIFR
jgi:hypothetical protein